MGSAPAPATAWKPIERPFMPRAAFFRSQMLRFLALAVMGSALLGILATRTAAAAPEDEYKEGQKAYGRGDVTRAMTLLRKPADAGNAKAQALLAEILDRSEFNEEAFDYYRKSAEQGDADGEYGLAGMYASGEGVKKDPQEALKWFMKAADQGHAQALKVVAGAYIFGDLGLDDAARNSDQAAKWIKRAADVDFVPAVETLAKAYRSGGNGIEADAKQAEVWEAKLNKLRPPPPGRKNVKK